MKFLDAKAKLKEIAKGRYHSVKFELTEDSRGNLETSVYLYINPSISAIAPTFEQAFTLLDGGTITEELPEVDG